MDEKQWRVTIHFPKSNICWHFLFFIGPWSRRRNGRSHSNDIVRCESALENYLIKLRKYIGLCVCPVLCWDKVTCHTYQWNRGYITCTQNCCTGLWNSSLLIFLELCMSGVNFLMLLCIKQGSMSSFPLGDNNNSNHSLNAYYEPGTGFSPSCTLSHLLLPTIPSFSTWGQLMYKEYKQCGHATQFLRGSRSCWSRQLDSRAQNWNSPVVQCTISIK